jgi:excisionase family DNA binding protein
LSARGRLLLGEGAKPDAETGSLEFRSTLPAAVFEALAQRTAAIVLEQLGGVNDSPLLTVPEAAAWLRCGRQRIDDLLSQGRLTRHKDGARTLVSRAELAAYVGLDGVAPALPRAVGDGL